MFVQLTDMPADFVAATSVSVTANHRWETSGNDAITAYYGIYASDETTALSAESSGTALPTIYNTNTYTVAATGSTTKTSWDAARLRIRQGYVKSGAIDATSRARVSAVAVAITYVSTSGRIAQTGFIFENDDEDEVGGDALDDNTQQAAGGAAITGVRVGERVSARVQLKNTGAAMSSVAASAFYDRGDGIFTKVNGGGAVVAAAGNCTDTNFDCSAVDSTGDTGQYAANAIDKYGNAWMSYYDNTTFDLRVARYVGTGGSGCASAAWMCTTIDSTGDVGQFTSIAFDATGTAWISYYDVTNLNLKVAFFTSTGGTGCATTAWTCTIVDSTGDVGRESSIAFDASSDAWISYRDTTNLDLKATRYVGSSGTGCASTAWTCTTVDSTNDVGKATAIAVDPSDNVWISSYDTTNFDLRVAKYVGSGGTGCASTAWTCTAVDTTSQYGDFSSIALDPSGNPWISYYDSSNADLRMATYVGSSGSGCASTAWTCITVDGTTNVGAYTSIAFDPAGQAWVSYQDSTNTALKLARYVSSGGSGCASSAWTCTLVDTPNNVGSWTSMAFDPTGNARISYRDDTNLDLRVAHLVRGGEIQIGTSLAGAKGDALNESHADMTTSTDTTNRDDADCIGGGTWNNGVYSEAEGLLLSLPAGSPTAQCTEVAFTIDTSNARAGTTYRIVIATNDNWSTSKGAWRGPISVASYPTLTTEAIKSTRIAKDASPIMPTCADSAWGCEAIDSTDDVGTNSSMAVGPDGTTWITYMDKTTFSLRVARYVGSGGTGCATTAWTCTTIGAGTNSDSYTSIAFDHTGKAWISFYDVASFDLKVATYVGSGGTGCTSTAWKCETVDATGTVGEDSSISIDSYGVPWVAYFDGTNGALKLARYVGTGGTGCASLAWTCAAIESTNIVGYTPSLSFDLYGKAWVSYRDATVTTLDLRVAHYVGSGGTGCAVTTWTCIAVDSTSDVGSRSSLSIDSSGNPWVSYKDVTNLDLRVARYVGSGGTGCATTAWTCVTVDSTGDAAGHTSLAFDASGTAWVGYSNVTNGDLRVARYVGSGGSCASAAWSCSTVDSTNVVGTFPSIAFDRAGYAWVSYYDTTNGNLRVAKLLSPNTKPVTTTGIAYPARSASRADGRYLLDLGDTARPVAGTCDAASGRTGYCGVASSADTALDGITAQATEAPQFVMSAASTANTAPIVLSWTGRSTVAPSSNATSMAIWRGGTTNSWQAVTLSTNTCTSTAASTDCTMTGTIATNLSEYYDVDGSAYRVHARVSQVANAASTETLSTNVLTMTAGIANTAPSSPSSLLQKTTGDVVLATGAWNSSTSVKFTATVTDSDATDTNQLCVEAKALGLAFTNTEDGCGSAVTQGGTASVTSVLTNGTEYHWQVRSLDAGGLYSPWVPYDVNAESARDVGIDTTAPTTGTVYDGLTSGVDSFQNNGSLTTLSANWDGFSDAASGITNYAYAIGTTAGGTNIRTWTSVTTSTLVTANALSLSTSIVYYFSVRATDGAGNVATVIYSNGQKVAPVLVFAVASVGAAASCGDATTTVASTTTGFDLGRLTNISQHPIAGQSLAVTTNGAGGYSVYLSYFGPLTGTSSARLLTNTASTNASPAVWPADGTEAFGYATSSNTLSGTANRFRTNKWARPDTVNAEIMRSTTPVPGGETACLAVQASQAGNTASDAYTGTMMYTAVPSF